MALGVVDRLLSVNFSGRDALPPRNLALQFNLPVQMSEKRYRPEQNLNALKKEFRSHGDTSFVQLELAIEQLSLLVRYKCSIKKRWAMLELVGAETSALIRHIYMQYRDESGVVESNARKHNLEHLLELLRLLNVGFQQVFSALYQLPEYRYQRQRKSLRSVGMRILELFYVEQRVCALRYQLFPPQRWRDLNQVFFVLWLCGEVDESQSLMIDLPCHLRSAGLEKNKEIPVRPRQLFVLLQLFGLADCCTWPSDFVQVLDSYIKLLEPEIALKPDEGGEVPSSHLLTFSNSGRAPFYHRVAFQGVGCLIDIAALKQQISRDAACLNALTESEALQQVSAPLSVLNQTQRLTFVELLQNRLQPQQRQDSRDLIDDYRDFSIVSGFMNCYKKLPKSCKKPTPKGTVFEITLDEMLDGRSSTLADDSRDIKEGQWYVINDCKGGVLVRAKESRYLVALDVGQLALFSQVIDPGSPPQLGCISRLLRSGQGEIAVTLQKLTSQAENVVLQTASMHQSGEAVPAFLVRAIKGMGWQLLVPSKYTEVLSDNRLFMRRSKRLFSVAVIQVVRRHKDYALLDIQSTSND